VPGVPGAQGPAGAPGTLETPAPDTTAGQVTLSGGRRTARVNLAISGTTTFPFLTAGYDLTGPGSRLSGYGTAKVPPPLVIVTRRQDGLSAKLLQACATGEHFQKIVLQVFKGGTTTPYETFTLTDAIITSVQFSSHGADVPEEAEHFAAQKVTVQFAAGASNPLPAFRFSSTAKTKLKFPR
jgi:type VI protein secretion system component Hcp